MEEHKHRALIHFLKRSRKPLQHYIDSIYDVAQDLKDSYDSLDQAWERDTCRFLQLMILDGCFLLEILRFVTRIDYEDENLPGVYAISDPLFSNHGRIHVMPYIKRDMLMLENQLPMLLLQKLLAVEDTEQSNKVAKKLILGFLGSDVLPTNKCLHVLDVYSKSLFWEDPGKGKKKQQPYTATHSANKGSEIMKMPSATRLHEAGIRLIKSKRKGISFEGGVLRLPQIIVDDGTESVFLNLLAFERFHVGVGNEVASYIIFMRSIIDRGLDVRILNYHGIIQHAIGSDEAVAKLFDSLSQDITLNSDGYLEHLTLTVNSYCNKPWTKWRANMMHEFFTNPRIRLFVVSGTFFLALTIAQTIYSALAYYHPSDASPSSSPNH